MREVLAEVGVQCRARVAAQRRRRVGGVQREQARGLVAADVLAHADVDLGFGSTVVLEIEVPNMLAFRYKADEQ